jgi:Glyoxalase-like domain
MSLARFKDLSIDARDPELLGRFWATLLGLDYVALDDGDAELVGTTPQQTVWVNAVPEAKSVKHRVHLDVRVEAIADLETLGAGVLERSTDHPWTVMADPEGGEFCAFVVNELRDYRLFGVVVDSADANPIAGWWADVLGGKVEADEQSGCVAVTDVPGMPFEAMVFAPVPEPKTVKNRIHWDVDTDDLDGLLTAGATSLRPKGDGGIGWHVLADPEGNEFCAFTPD